MNSAFKKATELKDNLNEILENFVNEAQYWIELEHSSLDVIILKVSLKSNLQQILDQIAGDISGLVTYEVEIEDFTEEGEQLEKKLPVYQVAQQRPDFQRIYDDIDKLDSLVNRPFIKEVVVEGEDTYSEISGMSNSELKDISNNFRESYEQEVIYSLSRVIKINVISDLD